MGFKYKEGRVLAVQAKDIHRWLVLESADDFVGYKGTVRAEIKLNMTGVYRAYCTNGKFCVSNGLVRLWFDEHQMDLYFSKLCDAID